MADVNANIGVNIDTSDALSQLKALQRQISQFHASIIKSSEAAATAQRNLQKNFINSVNSIGAFSAELRTVRTTAETFTNSLEKNKFSMREYFRYAAASTQTFGRFFQSEFSTIEKTAVERVKNLQTQYIKMGRDANGAMQAIAIRPTILDMQNLGTQTQIAAQKQAIFNQLVKQGSTNLLNFGKNTQWAGRQLMVGFTLPLISLGTVAGKTFMEMEQQVIKFRKVYGDLFTPSEERDRALQEITALAKGFTQYGIAAADTVGVAAEAAAAGFQGVDLQRQTEQALRLSVLGQVEYQKALETTISLQNAFQMSSADLGDAINFLNAVENQTVVSLDDITTAIPKVAPVIQSLGGDVKDLAFFLAAMKEGGVNASEGANALKSGLASLINPTDKAAQFLGNFGINLRGIVEANKGDVRGIVLEFARALDRLDPTQRAQAIEQLFGKFQFARLSTLFENVIRDGNQASRVLGLAEASLGDLASMAESELGMTAESAMSKFRKAIEDLQLALVPIGEVLLQVATPILDFVTKLAEGFNNLPEGVKRAITTITVLVGGLGPVILMTFGLLANGIANIIKFGNLLRVGYLKLSGQTTALGADTQYLTVEQLEAAAAAASLDQAHAQLTQRFTVEKGAVDALRNSYLQAMAAGQKFAQLNPNMIRGGGKPTGFASGGFVGGSGSGDIVPAMLTPGEFVVNKQQAKIFMPLLEAINAGKIPGFQGGGRVDGRNVNIGGTSFSTASTRSAAAVDAFISKLEKSGIEMDQILNLLNSIQSNGQRISTERLREQARETGLLVEEIKLQRMHLQRDLEVLPTGERALGSLVRLGTESQNQQLRKGQTPDVFMSEWLKVKDGLIDTLNVGGLKITDEIRQLAQEIDTEIAEAAVKLAQATERGLVDDKVLADATKQVIERNIAAGGTRADIAATMAQQSQKRVIAPPTKESLQQAGLIGPEETWTGWLKKLIANGTAILKQGTGEIQIEIEGKLRTIARVQEAATRDALNKLSEVEQRAALVSGKLGDTPIKFTTGERRAEGPGTYLDVGTAQTQARLVAQETEMGKKGAEARVAGAKKVLSQEQNDPAMLQRSAKRNSPHPQVKADATADAQLYQETFEQQVQKTKSRRASSGGVGKFDQKSGKYMNEAAYDRQMQARQVALQRVTAMTTQRISDLSNKAMGASFAISSVAGIMSMFGGEVGAVAGQLMNVTNLLFALSTATSLLIKTQMAQNAIGLFTKANGFAGMAAGATGFTKVANIFKGLVGIVSQVAMGLGRLIPVIGIAILAFQTFKVFQQQKENVEALGNAANLSAEKLNKLGERFNVTARQANFAGQFTAQQGSTVDERTRTQQLVDDEQFATDFKTEIDAIKNASKADAEQTLAALAQQLAGSGFDTAAVNAIINAIAIEAGKTDINLSFAKIDFGGPQGQQQFAKVAQEAAQTFQKSFKQGGDFLDMFDMGVLSTAANTAGGQFASLFESLKTGFEGGLISADEFNTRLNELTGQLAGLDGEALSRLIPEIAERLGIQDQISGLSKVEDKLMIIKAAAAGVVIDEAEIKKLEEASKAGADATVINEAIALRKKYNQLIAESAGQTEANNQKQVEATEAQEAYNQNYVQSIGNIEEQIQAIQNENATYDELIRRGWSAADAIKAVSDANFVNAFSAATNAAEQQKVIDAYKQLQGLLAQSPVRRSGGGGGVPKKSDFQEAIEGLQKQRAEIKNNISAFYKLTKAGFSAKAAAEAAGDPQIAAAIAKTKPGTKEWEKLIKLIKETRIQAKKLEQLELNIKVQTDFDGFLDDMISKANEYFDILERDVESRYRDRIKKEEAAIAKAEKEIEDLQDQIAAKERVIELTFDRPIAELEEEASDLSNDLAIIDQKSKAINEKYDAQKQALEQISKINQDIINQQKSQISLADALSQGDISAAAQLMQDMRAQNAAASAGSMTDALEAARQAELGGLTGNAGLTREQIEQRQFEISQKIYNLEEQKEVKLREIRDLQDKIYAIETGSLKAAQDRLAALEAEKQALLDAIDAQRQKWEEAKLAQDLANIRAGKYNDVLEIGKLLVGDIKKTWDAIKSKIITLTIKEVRIPAAGGTGGGGGGGGGGGSTTTTTTTTTTTPGFKQTNTGPAKFTSADAARNAATQPRFTSADAARAAATANVPVTPSNKPQFTSADAARAAATNPRFTSADAARAAANKAFGGIVKKMARGGMVGGTGMGDVVPTLLTPGEFVVNKASTKQFMPMLKAINESKFPTVLRNMLAPREPMQAIINVKPSVPSWKNLQPTTPMPSLKDRQVFATSSVVNAPESSNSVYNYNLTVNVKSSANINADSIANTVIARIKQIDAQRVRGQVVR